MMGDIKNPITYHKYKLLMYGNTLCVKGKYDITSYDDSNVMLNCAGDILCISGDSLIISSLDVDSIYISGKITDISIS